MYPSSNHEFATPANAAQFQHLLRHLVVRVLAYAILLLKQDERLQVNKPSCGSNTNIWNDNDSGNHHKVSV